MTNTGTLTPSNKWRWLRWGAAAALLLLPAIAMQFTREVNWDATDFIVMGILMAFPLALYEVASRARQPMAYRLGVAVALAGGFLLIWVNLAVGIIGSEDNPINAWYLAAPMIALAGSSIALFKPTGMMWAMIGAAASLFAIFVYALITTGYFALPITLFFAAFWATAAALFRKASLEG
jgi:hypothetical protein